MLGLMGFVIVAAATTHAMYTPPNTAALDFDTLNTMVSAAKTYNQSSCMKNYGLTPLIIAICKGDEETVISLQQSNPDLMKQKVHGLFPIHWAVVAKQTEMYEMLAKDQRNIKKTQSGLTPFDLQVKFDAWCIEKTEEREGRDHYCDSVNNWMRDI